MTTEGPVARLRIERAFKNEGLTIDELLLNVAMPTYASITSAKIYEQGEWKSARYEEAEAASELYNEKKRRGEGLRILISERGGVHHISISPIASLETVIISYDVEIEMDYNQGYSFAWDLAPNGLESENLSAVKFSSDRSIRLKGTKRVAGEEFMLSANGCEEKGFLANCQFVEINHPVTNEENIILTLMTRSNSSETTYQVISPDGTISKFSKNDFVALQETGTAYLAQKTLQNAPGIWRLVASPKGPKMGSLKSELIKVALGEVEATKFNDRIDLKDSGDGHDRIYILDSEVKEGNIGFGTFKSGKMQFSKIDVLMPKRLSELPKDATMIFLIDSSLSQTRTQFSHQLSLVGSIASHTDDEDVVLISYNRNAERISFQNDELEAKLLELKNTIRLENGSDLGAALSLAGQYIEKLPSNKPVLVYAMTDLLFKTNMTQASLLPKISNFKNNVTLHVVEIRVYSDFSLKRDDTISISGLSRQTRGVSVVASFPKDLNAELDKQTLYLVRPNRLEHAQLTGFGPINSLGESDTVSKADWKKIGNIAELKGQLWSQPFRMQGKATRKRNIETMRFALNDIPSDDHLSYQIAEQAGVVSEYISLFKDGDGMRGDIRRGFGLHGGGYVSSSSCRGGHRGINGKKVKPDYSGEFATVAKTCDQNHSSKNAFQVSIETTYSEIVDVEGSKTSAYEKCIVEGVWDKHLTDAINTGKYTFVFDGSSVFHK